MTQDEIIKIAFEAGLDNDLWLTPHTDLPQTIRFAELIAAKEREACAKVANQISDKYSYGYYGNEVDTADEIAKAIRARGEQT